MMKSPLVSVILVNYRQIDVTIDCIASLQKISYSNIEIVLVDNGSADERIDDIISRFPEVILVKSRENLGFAGGNNLGIKASRGKFIIFLNNDTEVEESFIEPLLSVFDNSPKAGIACSKLIFYGTAIIQYAGSSKINPYTGRSKRIGFGEEDTGQYDKNYKTDLPHGAAMMVPRKVIEEAGMMPELYFLYYEEVDWAESIKNKGYEIWFSGYSNVYHKESISTGKNSTLKTYYLNRNRIVFLRRNTRGLQKFSWIIFYALIVLPKTILQFIVKREIQHLRPYFRAVLWNFSYSNSFGIKR